MYLISLAFAIVMATIVPESSQTAGTIARKRVDLIELNHFVDDQGREVFRQVIFYDWSEQHRRFHVRKWHLIKNDAQLPVRRWNPQRVQCSWFENGELRQVWAPSMRESWSQRDPERVNRAVLPEDQRIPLFPPRARAEQIAEGLEPMLR